MRRSSRTSMMKCRILMMHNWVSRTAGSGLTSSSHCGRKHTTLTCFSSTPLPSPSLFVSHHTSVPLFLSHHLSLSPSLSLSLYPLHVLMRKQPLGRNAQPTFQQAIQGHFQNTRHLLAHDKETYIYSEINQVTDTREKQRESEMREPNDYDMTVRTTAMHT